MASASITVRTDDKLKAKATTVFANLGMDMTTAINVFLRAAIRENGIPFAVINEPDEEYRAFIKKTIAERMEKASDPNRKLIPENEVWEKMEQKWGGQ